MVLNSERYLPHPLAVGRDFRLSLPAHPKSASRSQSAEVTNGFDMSKLVDADGCRGLQEAKRVPV